MKRSRCHDSMELKAICQRASDTLCVFSFHDCYSPDRGIRWVTSYSVHRKVFFFRGVFNIMAHQRCAAGGEMWSLAGHILCTSSRSLGEAMIMLRRNRDKPPTTRQGNPAVHKCLFSRLEWESCCHPPNTSFTPDTLRLGVNGTTRRGWMHYAHLTYGYGRDETETVRAKFRTDTCKGYLSAAMTRKTREQSS